MQKTASSWGGLFYILPNMLRLPPVLYGSFLDAFNNVVVIVGDFEEVEVGWVNGIVVAEHLFFEEGDEVWPIVFAHQKDRNAWNFAGLNKGECLEQFVNRAITARVEDECFGREHQNSFSRKEVFAGCLVSNPRIRFLFVGETDGDAY